MDKKNFRFDYHYSKDETPRATVCRGETLKEAEDSFRSIYVNGFFESWRRIEEMEQRTA